MDFAFCVFRDLLDNPINCNDLILRKLAASIILKSKCSQMSNIAISYDLHSLHSKGKLIVRQDEVSFSYILAI